jgi:hypothetical protein
MARRLFVLDDRDLFRATLVMQQRGSPIWPKMSRIISGNRIKII